MKYHSLSRNISILLAFIISVGFLSALFIYNSDRAHAAPITDFNAGNIIDDRIFYNKNSMNVQQIQTFLDSLIPNCDVWGTQASGYGGLTNAQYAQQVKGWPGPPYPCLNKYHENPNNNETSYEKGGGAFSGGISAAQIIYNAAQTYNINPQVLLVMLKKESLGPLTADNWPLKNQYKYSMGYACPDSGPNYSANCDTSKAGFYKQMMLAAWQLNYYKEHPNDYRYHLGWNDIQYSTDPGCGTKRVYIENMATLSLYIYTPYTPNNGALAAYPGTASCGAYGNRNFFAYFREWFGITSYNGKPIKTSSSSSGVFLVENGIKRPFNSVEALYSHGYSWPDVITISESLMTEIPTGAPLGINVAAYAGKLLKTSSPSSGVFLIENGTKRPFNSADALNSYGYDWSKILTVSEAVLVDIPLGSPLGINIASFSGKTIKSNSPSSGVFLVENSTKRPFSSAEALNSHRYSWANIQTLSEAAMAEIPTGSPLGINIPAYAGKLIKSNLPGSGIFIVENNTKRPFESAAALNSYGYDWSKILTLSEAILAEIPLGSSLGMK